MAFYPPQTQYLSDAVPIWAGAIQSLVANGLGEAEIGMMVILWTRSLTESPCGSLPNDIDVIRGMVSAAGRDNVENLIFENWLIGADNRLYHPEFCMALVDAINKSSVRSLGVHMRNSDTSEVRLLLPSTSESLIFDWHTFSYNKDVHGPVLDPSDPGYRNFFMSLAHATRDSAAFRERDSEILLPASNNTHRQQIPNRDTSKLNTPEKANAFDFRSLALLGGNYSIGKVNQAWLDICLHHPEGISKALLKKSISDSIRLKGQSLNISYFSAVIKSNAREMGLIQFRPYADEACLNVLCGLSKDNRDALVLILEQMDACDTQVLLGDLSDLISDPKSLAIKVSELSDSFGVRKVSAHSSPKSHAKRSAMEYL